MKSGIIAVVIVLLIAVSYALFHKPPVPASTQTPTPSAARSVTPTPKPTTTPTRSPTPVPSASLTPTPSGSSTPVPTPTPTPTPTQTTTPTPTPTGSPVQQAYTVLLQNRAFNPSTLTVTKGDPVTFQAVDARYSITVGGARSSGNLQPGQQWTLNSGDFPPGTYRMTEASYTYMIGTLIVQ